jgi:hypothetical protein
MLLTCEISLDIHWFLCGVLIGWVEELFFFFVNGRSISIWRLAAPNPVEFYLLLYSVVALLVRY